MQPRGTGGFTFSTRAALSFPTSGLRSLSICFEKRVVQKVFAPERQLNSRNNQTQAPICSASLSISGVTGYTAHPSHQVFLASGILTFRLAVIKLFQDLLPIQRMIRLCRHIDHGCQSCALTVFSNKNPGVNSGPFWSFYH